MSVDLPNQTSLPLTRPMSTGNAFFDLLLLAVPLGLGLFWWHGARARELAVRYASQACRRESVQLLDQTVALTRWRPARLAGGSLGLRRDYRFEFTEDGRHRDGGEIRLLGQRLERVHFPYRRDEDGNRVFNH